MKIIISNNPDKSIYSESYDKVIYLGFIPDKELEENESIVLDNDILIYDKFTISTKGITKNNTAPKNKYDFINNHKKGINQILLNDRHTNINDARNNNEHYYVGLINHYELEI